MLKNGLRVVFAAAIGAITVVTPQLSFDFFEALAGPLGMPLAFISGIAVGCKAIQRTYKDIAPTLSSAQKNFIYAGYIVDALAGIYGVHKNAPTEHIEGSATGQIEATSSLPSPSPS